MTGRLSDVCCLKENLVRFLEQSTRTALGVDFELLGEYTFASPFGPLSSATFSALERRFELARHQLSEELAKLVNDWCAVEQIAPLLRDAKDTSDEVRVSAPKKDVLIEKKHPRPSEAGCDSPTTDCSRIA